MRTLAHAGGRICVGLVLKQILTDGTRERVEKVGVEGS